ncbi:hypothetical protein GH714_018070 [Hevea brasiliensis]|uniref:PIPK domain-containing protein n=1 Tax=Hevea brasiliensis TaxID=3981 RepID=A0A6A6LKA6_HEVBR|nr:hypothetical protein GH714_018070 [Hevea brasiliensis]
MNVELLQKALNREAKKGQPVIDILEINRLRRQLLFQSYMWDHRLIYAASLDNNSFHDNLNWSSSGHEEKPIANTEQLNEMNVNAKPGKGFSSCNSLPVDTLLLKIPDQQGGLGSNPDHSDTAHEKDKSQGENLLGVGISKDDISVLSDSAVADLSTTSTVLEGLDLYNRVEDQNGPKVSCSPSPALSVKGSDNMEASVSYLRMPFLNFYRSLNKNFLASSEKLNIMGEYSPIYVSSFRKLELQGGARLLLPVGVNDTVIPVYDDEPTSIISYALLSPEYHGQLTDDGDLNSSLSLSEPMTSQSFHTVDEVTIDSHRSLGSTDESILPLPGSRSPLLLDPLFHTKAMHARVSFGDEGPLGKVKHSVTCYYAKRFEALRRICCPSELDFIRSLSRCKKWGAQGGKSNVFFAKTLDDRFIIKQVTKTELESFIKFAPEYFKYLSDSISSRSPTCLAKILGIYQVTSKHLKGGKESKMDVLVMENLLFGRNVTRLYDLKGSSRSRYNPDSSGSNKVLLDQNLIEAMPTSPIFVGNKAKRLLRELSGMILLFLRLPSTKITLFSMLICFVLVLMQSIDVMDYSLLVGLDEERVNWFLESLIS